jgi:putative methyltransferase
MEYKRLRKFHREGRRKSHEASTSLTQMELQEARHTPPTHPSQPVATSQRLELMPREYPRILHRSIFTLPRFDLRKEHFHKQPDVVSPGPISDADHFLLAQSTDTSSVILAQNRLLSNHQQCGNSTSSKGGRNQIDTSRKSIASSSGSVANTLPNIRDIMPWIDYEYGITLPSHIEDPPIMHNETSLQATKSSIKKTNKDSNNIVERNIHHHAKYSPPMTSRSDRRKSGDFNGMAGFLSPGASLKGKDSRKSILMRSRNPMAKLFDGTASVDEEVDEYLDNTASHPRQASLHTLQMNPKRDRRKQRASSSDGAIRVHSPVPIRPFSPETPFPMARRGAIYTNENNDCHLMVPIAHSRHIEDPEHLASPHDDPFIERPPSRLCTSLPSSLNKLRLQPKTAATLGSGPALTLSSNTYGGDVEGRDAAQRLLHTMDSLDIKIPFKNPFGGSPAARKRTGRESSVNIAPDVVV